MEHGYVKAYMQHSEESIRRLSLIQHRTFCGGQRLLILVTAIVFILLGTLADLSTATSLVMVALGCWTMMSMNTIPDRNAKRMIHAAKGRFPASSYVFDEACIHISGDGETRDIAYESLYALVQDAMYVYLFLNAYSSYMVPWDSVEGASRDSFSKMLSERSGLSIMKPGNLLTFRFRNLRRQN